MDQQIKKLTVEQLPNPSFAFTNSVYTNQAPFPGRYVTVNGHVFLCKSEQLISDSGIGLNSLQRDTCRVGLGEVLEIRPYDEKSCKDIYSMELEIDLIGRKRAEIKEAEVIEKLMKYESDIFVKNATFCIDIVGIPIKLKVKSVRVVESDSGEVDVRIASEGRIRPDSKITIFFDEEKGSRFLTFLKIENKRTVPLFESDAQFESMGIGGLDKEFTSIFRRAFASRLLSLETIESFGVKHVKGMLLHGPPGTGKTLIARQIGKMLGGIEPKIVNGPEILNKFVGQAEENIRNLFADAVKDYEEKKENAGLHVIIFDEIDAICKARGSVRSGTGVHDTVVNQLLTMIDGVNTPNNILVIGMTNRKDLLDPALLRPGRLEVHVEISLPDEQGRVQIINIHTKTMKEHGTLSNDVDVQQIAKQTRNFSGAELEGLVKSATSYAIADVIDVKTLSLNEEALKGLQVNMNHFLLALNEIKPAFGVDEDKIAAMCRSELIEFGPRFHETSHFISDLIDMFKKDDLGIKSTVLLHGGRGSGKTSLVAQLVKDSDIPFVKVIEPASFIGLSDAGKATEIAQIFEQAYKSPSSVVILDNLEELLEYVHIGPRFSNIMLQTLSSILSSRHPNANGKLMILATSSNPFMLHQLKLHKLFKNDVLIPNIVHDHEVRKVFQAVGIDDEMVVERCVLEFMTTATNGLGISQLLHIIKTCRRDELFNVKMFTRILQSAVKIMDDDF